MRHILKSFVLVLGVVALAACGGSGAGMFGMPKTRGSGTSVNASGGINSKIKNVIVVVLENRSFDNMFQFYDHKKADIASISGTAMSKGKPALLLPATLAASSTDVGHSHSDFLADDDKGKNDGWPTLAYGYVPKSEVQPDLDIASQFAISDRFFHGITGPTFPSHVEIGGADTYGIIGNPSASVWGCDSPPGTVTDLYDPNVPGEVINGGGPFPCFDELSIFDLLDRGQPKPISWRFYDEPMGYSATGNENIAGFYRHIRYGPDWNNDIAQSDLEVLTALSSNTLPQVSFVIPNEASTDHAGTPSLGPMYLETLVNRFGASAYFKNTLMIVTWDDWGGWYDHVAPPKRADGSQLSFRKPILFVGAYVKHGYVSHVQTEDASIAKTIENVYSLGTMGAHDVAANDFSDVVDVNQAPAAFVPITSQEVAAAPLPSPVPPLPINARPRFRIVPPNMMGRDQNGKYFSGRADYYGSQSDDY